MRVAEITGYPGHPASSAALGLRTSLGETNLSRRPAMADAVNALITFSDTAIHLVERAAGSIVTVRGGGRQPSSGIHWRSGVIVTAEEALEADEKLEGVMYFYVRFS
jgi:hypothetical protein